MNKWRNNLLRLIFYDTRLISFIFSRDDSLRLGSNIYDHVERDWRTMIALTMVDLTFLLRFAFHYNSLEIDSKTIDLRASVNSRTRIFL